jgi:hypothetical protein
MQPLWSKSQEAITAAIYKITREIPGRNVTKEGVSSTSAILIWSWQILAAANCYTSRRKWFCTCGLSYESLTRTQSKMHLWRSVTEEKGPVFNGLQQGRLTLHTGRIFVIRMYHIDINCSLTYSSFDHESSYFWQRWQNVPIWRYIRLKTIERIIETFHQSIAVIFVTKCVNVARLRLLYEQDCVQGERGLCNVKKVWILNWWRRHRSSKHTQYNYKRHCIQKCDSTSQLERMASSETAQVSSLPLPPVQYINHYTDENIRRGRAPRPPPVIHDTYSMFGNTFNADDTIIRPLESQVCNCKGKGKVRVLNQATRHEDVLGVGCIAPCILDLGTRWRWAASRPGRFNPRERAPSTYWLEGWVGPRAVLDTVVKRKIPSPRRESNPRTPIVQPVAKRHTDWGITVLRYVTVMN